MKKFLMLLVALAAFAALPSAAFAGNENNDICQGGGDTCQNEQENEIEGDVGSGSQVQQQNCAANVGDVNCSQTQNRNVTNQFGVGGGDNGDNGHDDNGNGDGVSAGHVSGVGGGGGVGGVTLARTGFDAWLLALIGGLSLAGGLGLLAAQRRGRLNA